MRTTFRRVDLVYEEEHCDKRVLIDIIKVVSDLQLVTNMFNYLYQLDNHRENNNTDFLFLIRK